jgi:hypothetical protein
MDQHTISVIIGAIIALIAAATNKSAKSKDTDQAKATPDTTPTGQPVLTEADKRYREVQEEIRRRIAQQKQTSPGQPATVTPNPAQNYRPSKQITAPINKTSGLPKPQKSAPPRISPPAKTPTKTVAAQPVMAGAPAMEAAPAYPSEAAAYALPTESGDNAASSSTSPGGSNALRAILGSPGAARQAYLLREIFATPMGLRPSGSGGHEDWN